MYHGSEEELRAAEMAGRVYDNLCTSTPLELHGIRQLHTSHIGGASLDGENDAAYSSHNTSVVREQSQHRRRMGSGMNSVVEIARRESVLRQLYNDKLRDSISAILSALMNELPRDHIFLQLLNDPSTEQYCRVRVGEVVESFLFSVQAHQYHNLASELAKREVEVLTLSKQLEAQEEQLTASHPIKTCRTTQTDNSVDSGINTNYDTQRQQNKEQEEEMAHAELLALLEEVTREHELAKCRECLSAPTSLLETVQAEGNYRDKYEYLADVIAHLFRSVQGLVMYAEGSLSSLDSLRHGLRGASGETEKECKEMKVTDAGEQMASGSFLPNTTALAGRAPAHFSSSSIALKQQPRSIMFEEERSRLETLAAQLKYAQSHCNDLIESLSKSQAELRQQNDMHQQQLQQLQQLTAGNNSTEFNKALKANETALLQLREDLQQSFAMEREKAREREKEFEQRQANQTAALREATETLATVRQQLLMETEQRSRAEQRLRDAEHVIEQTLRESNTATCELCHHLEIEKNATQAKLCAAQLELIARRAHTLQAQQENIALEASVAKTTLLVERGYERILTEQHYTLLLAKEAVRHAQSQADVAQSALQEREDTTQQCYEDLRSLLECMREDEYSAEARQHEEEADTEARRLQRTIFTIKHNVASTEEEQELVTRKKNRENGDDSGKNITTNSETDTDGKRSQVRTLRRRYGTPTTLTGIVTALQNAYEVGQRRQWYMQRTVDIANERVRQLEHEGAALRSKLNQLTEDYEKQRESFKRMWDERAVWERQDTLKELLAKQEALLASVNLEREALQKRWSVLSEDYQTLERRNSQLHERCAAKEVENARLMGYLRAKQITPSPSQLSSSSSVLPQQEQRSSSSLLGVVQDSTAKDSESSHVVLVEGAVKSKEEIVGYAQDMVQTETPLLRRKQASHESSSAAGLSGQGRTSCNSVVEEGTFVSNNSVEAVVPLGLSPHERGVWRTAFRRGQGVDNDLTLITSTAKNEADNLNKCA